MLIQCDGIVVQKKLTEIHFKPIFLDSPITREGSVLTWDPNGKYIGDSGPEFQIQLENDESQEPWIYCETLKKMSWSATLAVHQDDMSAVYI